VSQRLLAAGALVLMLLVGTAFGGSVRHGFSDVDDAKYVTDNSHVRQGLTASTIGWAFVAMDAANWHPLTWLSHMADVSIFGLDPRGHHAVNLLLHAIATVLLFLWLSRATASIAPSFVVAAWFGIHPLRVESVAWIAERKDVLSLVFAMATLLAYDAYVKRASRRRLAIVIALFACGLMAKPMLVTLPIVMLLLDRWPYGRLTGRREAQDAVREKSFLFLAAAASAVVTFVAQSGGRAVESLGTLPVAVRLANAFGSIGAYLRQVAWPSGLSVFYPHPGYVMASGIDWPKVLAGFALTIAISIASLAFRRTQPYFLMGWLWFLFTLAPVIGIVQVGEQARADRYTYLPMIGVILAVVWGFRPVVDRFGPNVARAAAALVLAVVAAFWLTTRAQVALWNDPRALYRQALAHTERNYVAHNNLGVLLAQDGRIDEAQSHFEAAVAIVPGYAQAEDNLGTLLMKRARVAEAIPHFESARARSADPEIRNNLGNALIEAGRKDEGVAQLEEAIRLRPDYALAHFNLAMALGRMGRTEQALAQFDLAIRYRPDRAAAWANRGLLLATLGRNDEAASDFRRALELEPGWAEVRRALAALPR
jgi:tetratricopeptide (TPR) repeat protein